jgi:hypothetical protein
MKEFTRVIRVVIGRMLHNLTYTAGPVDGGNWREWGKHDEGDIC